MAKLELDESKLKKIIFTTEYVEQINEKMDQGFVIPKRDNPWLDGTEIGVRREKLSFVMTPEEQMEYLKCALGEAEDGKPYTDPSTQKLKIKPLHYFASRYCKIKTEDGSVGNMHLRDYQYDIFDLYAENRFSILCASRQLGKCVSPLTEVDINGKNIRMYKLYFRLNDNKSVYDYIKYFLYWLLDITS